MSADLNTVLESATLPEDAVEVARIGEAWGVRGWFRIIPYSSLPEALFNARQWFLLPAERGARHFEGTRSLQIRQVREHGDGLVAGAAAIMDRNAAQLLKGARILVPRSSFPQPEEGEYYWVDLIGCAVSNREGVALGTVRDLLATGPQTTLVLDAGVDAEGKAQERLIPFVNAFVDSVDVPGKRIVVDWQPDY